MNHCGFVEHGGSVLHHLGEMEAHGTTDGQPYVEPQPEIGDGYRAAMADDGPRLDLEVWCENKWQKTGPGFVPGFTYRVPVDRIPTDEDARQRPTVMVRDNDQLPWQKQTLLAVAGVFDKFITSPVADLSACFWMQARFPYPGELD
jgi:hypothetical protein